MKKGEIEDMDKIHGKIGMTEESTMIHEKEEPGKDTKSTHGRTNNRRYPKVTR